MLTPHQFEEAASLDRRLTRSAARLTRRPHHVAPTATRGEAMITDVRLKDHTNPTSYWQARAISAERRVYKAETTLDTVRHNAELHGRYIATSLVLDLVGRDDPDHEHTNPTQNHAAAPRSAQNHSPVVPDDRDDSEPAERRWRIRRYGAMWRAGDPNCRGRDEDGCRITATWTDAVDHVSNELRDRALAAIENQEATSQPQEDQ